MPGRDNPLCVVHRALWEFLQVLRTCGKVTLKASTPHTSEVTKTRKPICRERQASRPSLPLAKTRNETVGGVLSGRNLVSSAPPLLGHHTPPLPSSPTQPRGAGLCGAQPSAGRGPELGRAKPHSPGPSKSSTNGWLPESRGPPGYSQTYLVSFPQNGRNYVASEVPTRVVVKLWIVRWNCGPQLGPREAVGPSHCAHGHPIQNKALFESQRTHTTVRHPNQHSL